MSKIALVTGSRKGIGLATARKLREEGYFVILSGSLSEDRFAQMHASLLEEGFVYHRSDISKQEDRSEIFRFIDSTYGRLDLLVNNAGVAPAVRLDILQTTEESVHRLLDTNLCGTFFMCQIGANLMISMQQKNLEDYHPRIVNISSISSYTSSVNRGEYCMSKTLMVIRVVGTTNVTDNRFSRRCVRGKPTQNVNSRASEQKSEALFFVSFSTARASKNPLPDKILIIFALLYLKMPIIP